MGINIASSHVDIPVAQPSDSANLWRYMDLSKYLSLLQKQELYFCPQSAFSDPYEGARPKQLSFENIIQTEFSKEGLDAAAKSLQLEIGIASAKRIAGRTFVNCWHCSPHESEAMWKLYSSSGDSICIKTTNARLKSVLPVGVSTGLVQYIDFETYRPSESPVSYSPPFFKRLAFEHEKEFRAVIYDLTSDDANENMLAEMRQPNLRGKFIPIDIKQLIESVYINPSAPAWFVESVSSLTTRYGFGFNVLQSDLLRSPTY